MSVDMIFGLVIVSLVALVMVIIGLCQVFKREEPVGFYNVGTKPKREEISDVKRWNIFHGMIWIVYGICIELGFLLGSIMTSEILQGIFMIGGILIPLPLMILTHHLLEKKYKIK